MSKTNKKGKRKLIIFLGIMFTLGIAFQNILELFKIRIPFFNIPNPFPGPKIVIGDSDEPGKKNEESKPSSTLITDSKQLEETPAPVNTQEMSTLKPVETLNPTPTLAPTPTLEPIETLKPMPTEVFTIELIPTSKPTNEPKPEVTAEIENIFWFTEETDDSLEPEIEETSEKGTPNEMPENPIIESRPAESIPTFSPEQLRRFEEDDLADAAGSNVVEVEIHDLPFEAIRRWVLSFFAPVGSEEIEKDLENGNAFKLK